VDAAIDVFRYNSRIYSQSPNAWDCLGEALERGGRRDEALASYHRAVSIAEANHSEHLQAYRTHLSRLADKGKAKQ
jgi:cytochrome c-type biogenesis protein CcmH/NrfG